MPGAQGCTDSTCEGQHSFDCTTGETSSRSFAAGLAPRCL